LISDIPVQPLDRKVAMRRAAYDARNAQENKDAVSEKAIQRLLALPQYRQAHTVLWYIDCRSELRTRQALPAALASAQRIIVPYCTVDEQGANKLGLWWLTSVDELIIGKWKILEPKTAGGSQGRRSHRSNLTWRSSRASASAAREGEWGTAKAITTGCWRPSAPNAG
jgi:5-formyltetrahydrofolate cyclo-ligase